jgi:TRAP-type uncharacterized transport system fused permease subunit
LADRLGALVATGLLISSISVAWVALHSWAQRRSEDRSIWPTLTTLGVLALVLLILALPLPRQWTGLAIFAIPLACGYYVRKGDLDPGRRRVMHIGLVLVLVGVIVGLFALQSVDLLF